MTEKDIKMGSAVAMPFCLADKIILVTGGASGIGAGVARSFKAQGAVVIITDIAVTRASDQMMLDVGSEDQWSEVYQAVMDRHGKLDGLVHAAGILVGKSILDFDRAAFDRVIRTNLTGSFLAIKYGNRAMAASGGGSIVTFSSVEGLQGSNSMAAYAASKWGVRGLTKVAAIELGASGIRVNSIHPGPIDTPMVNPQRLPPAQMGHLSMFERMPISRMGDVEEVAAMCAYLVSDSSSFVTGSEFIIDGGLTAGNKVDFSAKLL